MAPKTPLSVVLRQVIGTQHPGPCYQLSWLYMTIYFDNPSLLIPEVFGLLLLKLLPSRLANYRTTYRLSSVSKYSDRSFQLLIYQARDVHGCIGLGDII